MSFSREMEAQQLPIRCLRCGRLIKNPVAREIGFGVVCAKKLGFVRVRGQACGPAGSKLKTVRMWAIPSVDPQALCDILGLVDVLCTVPDTAPWSDLEMNQILQWAAASHLRASDNHNHVPPRPKLIEGFPTVSAEMFKNGSIV